MPDKTYADLTAATDVQDADLFATWRPSGPGPLKKIQASIVRLYMLATLGTSALKNTGTSGNTVPLLDGANTWSAKQIFGDAEIDGNATFTGANSGPAEVWVSSGAISASTATLDIALAGGYTSWKLVLTGVAPVTNTASLELRLSVDNGATYKSGAADYSHSGLYSNTSGVSGHFEAPTETAMLLQPVGSKNAIDLTQSLEMRLFTPNGSNTVFMWSAHMADSPGALYNVHATGNSGWSQATNIRFLYSSGNIAQVTWALYGLRGV